MKIRVGARSSPVSRAQFEEVKNEMARCCPGLEMEPVWASSPGDRDLTVSLRKIGKGDFFTRDLDEMVREGIVRTAVHSAKDLAEPLPQGLKVVAITRGVDSRDSLVLNMGETLQTLKKGAVIAASSERREEAVLRLRSDLRCIDLRGTIGERLGRLERGEVDGVVVAEAALIRLKWGHWNRMYLPGETAPMQGRLAVVARAGDDEMEEVFQAIDGSGP